VSEPETAVRLAPTVYDPAPKLGDPAEDYHEASKLQPSTLARELRGIARLEQRPSLQRAATRSVRRHRALPRVVLPAPDLPGRPLAEVLAGRRSTRSFSPVSLTLAQVATLLWAAYGATAGPGSQALDRPQPRTAPSAGALYPLELYIAPLRVQGLRPRIHHYDPLDHALEEHAVDALLDGLSPDPCLPGTSAVVVFIAAVFWRSRFKYGMRAYRLTLLEAGHAAQNLLLAADASGLGAVVAGGFFDDRVDRLLGLDGVDESTLVGVCLGAR